MQMIGMRALRDFAFAGSSYAQGQTFEVVPIEAAAIIFAHYARFLEPDEPIKPEPVVETKALVVEPAPKARRKRAPRKGQYLRRDIAPDLTK